MQLRLKIILNHLCHSGNVALRAKSKAAPKQMMILEIQDRALSHSRVPLPTFRNALAAAPATF
jgi:hypothetical protein